MFVMHIWSSSVLAATSSRIAPQRCESSLLQTLSIRFKNTQKCLKMNERSTFCHFHPQTTPLETVSLLSFHFNVAQDDVGKFKS